MCGVRRNFGLGKGRHGDTLEEEFNRVKTVKMLGMFNNVISLSTFDDTIIYKTMYKIDCLKVGDMVIVFWVDDEGKK